METHPTTDVVSRVQPRAIEHSVWGVALVVLKHFKAKWHLTLSLDSSTWSLKVFFLEGNGWRDGVCWGEGSSGERACCSGPAARGQSRH